MAANVEIGTAGWAVPRAVADAFPSDGSALQRYAARFPIVEINSTFYRPHRPTTFERWAMTTPDSFRFCLKAPRAVSHAARLVDCRSAMAQFLADARGLGPKFSVILVQLPPSLTFDREVAAPFFEMVRSLEGDQDIVCEPRHASWFEADADRLLENFQVARVAADPARHPLAATPGGWRSFAYYRLHGSPRIYYSSYADSELQALADDILAAGKRTWCVFDNTASNAAAANALTLQGYVAKGQFDRVGAAEQASRWGGA